jgi:hypothetical protein
MSDINYISNDDVDTTEYLCNKMKIFIFFEIINFIKKDNNYEYFKLLFFSFNNNLNNVRNFYYNYYNPINNIRNDYNIYNKNKTYIFSDNLFDDIVEFKNNSDDNIITMNELFELKPELQEDITNFKLDYITFIILNNIYNIQKDIQKIKNIITSYIPNEYIDLYLRIDTYRILFYNHNNIYNKKEYLKYMIKIIKCIFLTNYIDINNIYAMTCLNIYLFKMNIIIKKIKECPKNEIEKLEKLNIEKVNIIITLLARLLLETNSFYLNNYADNLNINYTNETNEANEANKDNVLNFLDIFKSILTNITEIEYLDFKRNFYNCDDTKTKDIEYIKIQSSNNILFNYNTTGGEGENNSDDFKMGDPTYLLNYIPMNYCKRIKFIEFINTELNKS